VGVKRATGGDTVCPICYRTAEFCCTLSMAQARKFPTDPSEGVTRSQYVDLAHKEICLVCRMEKARCWANNGKRKYCIPKVVAPQDHLPEWWRPEELDLPAWKEEK
jgi:hypothetical protein